MPNPVTTGAELGSRCCVTIATGGQLQMKKGLNFQGLRPEGDFELCLSLELSGFGNVGGKGGSEKETLAAFCVPLLSHCHCAVGKGERHSFPYFNTDLCREACSQLRINELPCLWETGWWSPAQSNRGCLPPPSSLSFPSQLLLLAAEYAALQSDC